MDLDLAISSRRTIKAFTGAAIAPAVVDELVTAATWAPNHRLTQPWRFAVADRDAIAHLAAFVGRPPVSDTVEARKLAAILPRLAACGAVVQVTCVRSADPERQREDLAAVSAAVATLLLAAHGRGIGSYWSTNPLMTHPATLRWFGSDPAAEEHVATVWLGIPAETPPVPRRHPLAEVLRRVRPVV